MRTWEAEPLPFLEGQDRALLGACTPHLLCTCWAAKVTAQAPLKHQAIEKGELRQVWKQRGKMSLRDR